MTMLVAADWQNFIPRGQSGLGFFPGSPFFSCDWRRVVNVMTDSKPALTQAQTNVLLELEKILQTCIQMYPTSQDFANIEIKSWFKRWSWQREVMPQLNRKQWTEWTYGNVSSTNQSNLLPKKWTLMNETNYGYE